MPRSIRVAIRRSHCVVGAWCVLQATASAQPSSSTPDPILITQHPSVVGYSPRWWFTAADGYVCVDFVVRPSQAPVPHVLITSDGLGQVLFSERGAAGTAAQDCNQPVASEKAALELSDVVGDRHLRARLPASGLSSPGLAMQGRIVALVPSYSLVTVPLKLERSAAPPALQSFLWFLGVLIPALVTVGLARLTAAWMAYREEDKLFRDYLKTATVAEWLPGFFKDHYGTIRERDFLVALEKQFDQYKVFDHLPRRDRLALRRCIEKQRPFRAAWLLRRLFPTWRREIAGHERKALRAYLDRKWRDLVIGNQV